MRDLLLGPPPNGPAWLRGPAERWAHLPPRVRLALLGLLVLLCAGLMSLRAESLQARWGGPGTPVWRATATIPAGETPQGRLRSVTIPAGVLPHAAVRAGRRIDRPLSAPLVRGAILTEQHLDVAGPAATLSPGHRLLPVPLDPGWGVETGAAVDVWALAGPEGTASMIAAGRPVLRVAREGSRRTALVSLPVDVVRAAAEAVASGRVILTLAPGLDAPESDDG